MCVGGILAEGTVDGFLCALYISTIVDARNSADFANESVLDGFVVICELGDPCLKST